MEAIEYQVQENRLVTQKAILDAKQQLSKANKNLQAAILAKDFNPSTVISMESNRDIAAMKLEALEKLYEDLFTEEVVAL